MKPRLSCMRMMGGERFLGREKYIVIQSTPCHLSTTVQAMLWYELPADRSSRMRCEVYRPILSAPIKANAAKLSRHWLTVNMKDNPKESIESNPRVSQRNDSHLISAHAKLNVDRPTNKHQLKVAAVKACRCISIE